MEINIAALLKQDYPDFTLIIVVDNVEDPAWPMLQRICESAPDRIELQVLRNPLSTCSLKCSSLAQVVEGLDPSFEVVAFMDGDVLPHKGWLYDLVLPLLDRSVGVTTGTRWYMPNDGNWGSLVRYFWNTGAVVQAWLNDMVWGGSMAMRRDVMMEVGLPTAMRKAFADDATVVRQMKVFGYKTCFVPAVTMVNREEITFASFVQWSERQMICAKSCGPNFRMVDIHGFSVFCCLLLPIATALAGWQTGNSQIVGISLAAMATFWLAAAFSTMAVEIGVRHALSNNHTDSKWLHWRTIIRLFPCDHRPLRLPSATRRCPFTKTRIPARRRVRDSRHYRCTPIEVPPFPRALPPKISGVCIVSRRNKQALTSSTYHLSPRSNPALVLKNFPRRVTVSAWRSSACCCRRSSKLAWQMRQPIDSM